MGNAKFLSIITPTRGDFSEFWLQRLVDIQGEVEFVIVYPPGERPREISDPRVKAMQSPYKGEVIQRAVGLLNASGQYVIALDDDDLLHPQVVELATQYFELHPQSLCLRLSKKELEKDDLDNIQRPWDSLPNLKTLTNIPPAPKPTVRRRIYADDEILEDVPISPLDNRFKWRSLWINSHRNDQNGPHPENFNNIIWQTELTQDALRDLLELTQKFSPFVWIPFWSLDRLLGLFIQARLFQPGFVLGHRLWAGEQVRYIKCPSAQKGEVRSMFAGDLLLALRFPKYGYLWNLFFNELWIALKVWISARLQRVKQSLKRPKMQRLETASAQEQ